MSDPISAPTSFQPPLSDIQFSGGKMEYTKLWLVNMLLSVLTLGIYSAWAKVRNTQYLYGHTMVDGHRLSYLATPIQILRGRIIAAAIFVAYAVISSINPMLNAIMLFAFLIAMPWLLIQGLKFSLRMTAYRNVRFSLNASYGDAVIYFFLFPLLGALSFGLLLPWAIQRLHKFIHDSISFGGKSFRLESRAGYYYLTVMATTGTALVALIVFAILLLVAGASGLNIDALANSDPEALNSVIAAFMPLVLLAMFFINYLIAAVFQGMIRNHIMNNLSITGLVSFRSNISILGFAWLNLSNALLLIFTLGLGYPATQIRKNAFLAKATQVALSPAINTLVNTVSDYDSAMGEEAAGLFDADLSLT